ncbi:MAG: hypothetical protein JW850_09805 [Thermoflexales bacterium]|nr:hypothetical protein [Thermoflexales bacterium]
MDYGKELKRYVDDGAVEWKIDSAEKLCSVIAGKYAITLFLQDPVMNGILGSIGDGLRIAVGRLRQLNVTLPAKLNMEFHLRTAETFYEFGKYHNLTKKQQLEAVDFVESACEREVANLRRIS